MTIHATQEPIPEATVFPVGRTVRIACSSGMLSLTFLEMLTSYRGTQRMRASFQKLPDDHGYKGLVSRMTHGYNDSAYVSRMTHKEGSSVRTPRLTATTRAKRATPIDVVLDPSDIQGEAYDLIIRQEMNEVVTISTTRKRRGGTRPKSRLMLSQPTYSFNASQKTLVLRGNCDNPAQRKWMTQAAVELINYLDGIAWSSKAK